jgi:hypothetical protein
VSPKCGIILSLFGARALAGQEDTVRSPFRFILPALALGASLAWPTESRAEPPDSRFGLLPVVGGGIAGATAHGPTLPAFISYTTLGAELFGQLKTWGLFLRFDFLSSGNDAGAAATRSKAAYEAGYNAFSVDAGASYRLFGDSKTASLFGRGGITYEHWIGQESTPCAIPPFVPSGCDTTGLSTSGFEGDAIGVTLGARLELPLRSFYVAFGASFVPVVTVHTTSDTPGVPVQALQPGYVIQLRFDLAVGLRDNRGEHTAHHDYNEHRNSY